MITLLEEHVLVLCRALLNYFASLSLSLVPLDSSALLRSIKQYSLDTSYATSKPISSLGE